MVLNNKFERKIAKQYLFFIYVITLGLSFVLPFCAAVTVVRMVRQTTVIAAAMPSRLLSPHWLLHLLLCLLKLLLC